MIIVVVCAAFGLIVSEAKTEIMCLRTKRMPESTAIISVEATGQVSNQTNKFVYLGGVTSATMPTCPSRSIGAYATHDLMQLPEIHPPRTIRLTECSPRGQNPDAKSQGTRGQCCTAASRGARACATTKYAAPSLPQVPHFYLDTLIKTGSESIEAIMRRRRIILFAGCVARVKDTRNHQVKVCDVRRTTGGGCRRLGGGGETS